MRRFCVLLLAIPMLTSALYAQDDTYLEPPKVIADMLLAKPTPGVSIDDKGEWLLFTEADGYPSVEELARPELRLAGLRIDPNNFGPSRQRYINNIYLQEISSGTQYKIKGMPQDLAASRVSWSPNESKIAFLHTTKDRIDLYTIDVASKTAIKINTTAVNNVSGGYQWIDEATILYFGTIADASQAPKKPLAPKGPTIQESYGKASPRPTYQDMIKSPYDEELFAFYATTQLIRNENGHEVLIGAPDIYKSIDISPDRQYMLVSTVRKPFSYLVPFWGFPSSISITDMQGAEVRHLFDLPSSETAPSGKDNVQDVPNSFDWRNDVPASLTWCEPEDGGLIATEREFHDAVYSLDAPFNGEAIILFKTAMRYRGIHWGGPNLALVYEGLSGKYLIRTSRYNPATREMTEVTTRNTTDAYAYPGSPVLVPNMYDRDVLYATGDGYTLLYNNSSGSSPKGDLPYLMTYNVKSKESDTLWRCTPGSYESVVRVVNPQSLTIVTRKESKTEVPNFWMKDLQMRIADRQLTHFANPYPQLDGVSKEKISYARADGVNLTGELYLPAGYDAKRDGPLPVLLWAYPREFQSASDAGQVRGSEDRFTMLSWASPVYYVTQGYAVLNNAEMPVVATSEDNKPNDDFVDQIRMNAKAAIDKLAAMGVGDSGRVAVGGHSYGAFMTANLLAHTDYFKAGIARSGAYNRTLTPFGFQNEDRTYWEAPDIYNTMSPFMHADSIKTPLLLIHGDTDNNSGTFPIQSERLFNAVKGHGGTIKYVSLPYESHSYQGKENILHMLAEQLNWMDRYVKGVDEKKQGKS